MCWDSVPSCCNEAWRQKAHPLVVAGGCWVLWALSRRGFRSATEICNHGPPLCAGEYPDAVPAGAPVGIAVRLCGATELCAALQLMQTRLHPDLAQVAPPGSQGVGSGYWGTAQWLTSAASLA